MPWPVLAGIAVVTFLAVRGRFWPYGPCRCVRRGHGKTGPGSTSRAYSRCRRCGGSGEQVRLPARAWPRHRAEARKRGQARNAARKAARR